ncbi:MAG: DUF551 domain-containing protein [Methylobacter sp.]
MKWQPIETAPRDGTLVDIWMSGQKAPDGYRQADCWFDGKNWCHEFGREGPIEAGFYIGDIPTHWMPLPESPNAIKES